jgi:SAM-dependent methyltransferase
LSLVAPIKAFMRANRACSLWLARYLPNAKGHTYRVYPEVVQQYLKSEQPAVVLDVGGGKTCAYADPRLPEWHGTLVAVDIAPEELRHNTVADLRMVLDGTQGYPFADGAVDLITSRSVLEHLSDLDAFLLQASRVLKPGGYFIHWIPCKFAPFAIINSLLPNAVARRVLFFLDESKVGICGFPVVYDGCYPAALRRRFAAHGLHVESLRPSYYQSPYFAFFVPLFLLSSLYEIVLQWLGAENLCAHVLVVARKA